MASGRYDGAAYLCGYAIELALKARICRTLRWAGFPETDGEFRGVHCFKVHNFDVLLRLSGIEAKIKSAHLASWSVVSGWRPESRYNLVGTTTRAKAEEMIRETELLLGVL